MKPGITLARAASLALVSPVSRIPSAERSQVPFRYPEHCQPTAARQIDRVRGETSR